MPKLAANLTLMYQEVPFRERFAAAAADGFVAVEFLFPYAMEAAEVRGCLDGAGVRAVLFNCPPGDWDAGERGIAALPGRQEEFRRSIERALKYARRIGNQRLHLMAGLVPAEQDRARCRDVYLQNLAYAANLAASDGITILIEPINTRDMPGYFLSRLADARAVCRDVNAPNLKVQFDLYHCQIMEGDLATNLRGAIADIGHMQIAGVPERHEPDCGEIHYPYLFALMDDLGYDGWVGCEYRPRAATSAGLGWAKQWLLAN